MGIFLQTILVEISLLGFWWRILFPQIFWTFSAGVFWYALLLKEMLVEMSLEGFWEGFFLSDSLIEISLQVFGREFLFRAFLVDNFSHFLGGRDVSCIFGKQPHAAKDKTI